MQLCFFIKSIDVCGQIILKHTQVVRDESVHNEMGTLPEEYSKLQRK
jgi:hypothetical protein